MIHQGRPNVSKAELKEKIGKMYKVKDAQAVFLFGFKTQFGGGKSSGFGLIYDNLTVAKKFEPKYRLVRVGYQSPFSFCFHLPDLHSHPLPPCVERSCHQGGLHEEAEEGKEEPSQEGARYQEGQAPRQGQVSCQSSITAKLIKLFVIPSPSSSPFYVQTFVLLYLPYGESQLKHKLQNLLFFLH